MESVPQTPEQTPLNAEQLAALLNDEKTSKLENDEFIKEEEDGKNQMMKVLEDRRDEILKEMADTENTSEDKKLTLKEELVVINENLTLYKNPTSPAN